MGAQQVDVVVIGAGPAGSTAAALLQRGGYRPVILEKTRFPRFVIGESLLPRCMDLLEEAGMLDDVRARQYMVKNGAVFRRDDQQCAFQFGEQFTQGWGFTYQVPREDFDLTLVRSAEKQGVRVLWEHAVQAVDFSGNTPRLTVETADGQQDEWEARFVLDASGYGRVLPRLLDLERPSSLPVRESVFTHITGDIRPQGADEGRIWICMLPQQSWLWIIPFSNGKTSVGLVARPEFVASLPGETLDDKLRASFQLERSARERLARAEFTFPVRKIHGYSAAVTRFTGKGYALLGNASEFLDPVFSSGVTLALESANRAAKTLMRQLQGEEVDWEQEYSAYLARGVETFRTYVSAWYEEKLPAIFFSDNPPASIRSQICSVLAGYVWDASNPFVKDHQRGIRALAAACSLSRP